VNAISKAAGRIKAFLYRQKHNYRVGTARSAANSFLTGLTSQYNAIYAVELGADSVQVGSLSSVGGAISALIAAPVGWLIDRHGIKRFFLLSIVLTGVHTVLYAVAGDWRLLVAAAAFASVATRLSSAGCRVICADSVQSRDRVTAQNVCGTLAAIAGMVSPFVSAYLVTVFGGITVDGIRPLYYIQFAGYGLVFLLVIAQLREPRKISITDIQNGVGFIGDFRQLFKQKGSLARWIAISALTALPMAVF